MAELGSFSVEFTRLTQLTGDLKYYDAAQRIMNELDRAQETTNLPGLWPKFVDANSLKFTRNDFGIGACADSTYEYLPKEHIMVGGASDQYRRMYESAMEPIKKHLVFRAMTKDEDQHILFSADVKANSAKGPVTSHTYSAMHLSCFIGATIGLGAKLFNRPEDMYYARGLTDGCIWAYDVFPHGVMAEDFKVVPCDSMDSCAWDEKKWLNTISSDSEYARSRVKSEKLPPGVINVHDSNYKLRYVFLPPFGILLWPHANPISLSFPDPRPSNPSSTCGASQETSSTKTPHGACSRTSTRSLAPTSAIPPSTTCGMMSP